MIEDNKIKTVEHFKDKLRNIIEEQEQSLSVLISTERILTFQVADILDLSQLKNGVFRKNRQNFSIIKCI